MSQVYYEPLCIHNNKIGCEVWPDKYGILTYSTRKLLIAFTLYISHCILHIFCIWILYNLPGNLWKKLNVSEMPFGWKVISSKIRSNFSPSLLKLCKQTLFSNAAEQWFYIFCFIFIMVIDWSLWLRVRQYKRYKGYI